MRYLVCNNGCDDSTQFDLDLSDREFELIKKFCLKNNEHSGYSCQPSISIYSKFKKIIDDDFYYYEYDYKQDLLDVESKEGK